MNLKNCLIIVALGVVILAGCSKSTEPPDQQDHTYIPLKEGNIRQVITSLDSSTILMQEKGTVKRSDGTDVTMMLWTLGTQLPDTGYFFIKEGYYASTELTPGTTSANPYGEQRLGRTNPLNGETWKSIPGAPDSTYFTAMFFPERATAIGVFRNVFGFVLIHYWGGGRDTIMMPLYAEDIGYIGTDVHIGGGEDVILTYVKVGNVEMGKLRPPKDPPMQSRLSKGTVQRIIAYSYFGGTGSANAPD